MYVNEAGVVDNKVVYEVLTGWLSHVHGFTPEAAVPAAGQLMAVIENWVQWQRELKPVTFMTLPEAPPKLAVKLKIQFNSLCQRHRAAVAQYEANMRDLFAAVDPQSIVRLNHIRARQISDIQVLEYEIRTVLRSVDS